MTRRAPWLLALALLLAAVLGPGPAVFEALAQDEPSAADERGDEVLEAEEPEVGLEDIDELLEGEEEILAGEGYEYDPGSRRDPFKSLLVSTEVPSCVARGRTGSPVY